MKVSCIAVSSLAIFATQFSHVTSEYVRQTATAEASNENLTLESALFIEWMNTHDKAYQSHEELTIRKNIWLESHAFIEEHNSKIPKPNYRLGHNQFSDMTVEEYQEYNKLGPYSRGRVGGSRANDESPLRTVVGVESTTTERRDRHLTEIPDSVDWVAAGAVAPVKNQGMCGSCWAFSAICAIEGAHFLDTGTMVPLSEQELVDCDPMDLGCNGGLMDNAFLFDEDTTGICSEEDYPYVAHKHWFKGCASKKGLCEGVEHTRVKSFIDVENTPEALMEALVYQPVSVAIEADQRSFQLYKDGVYDDPECGNSLDHGVASVGYGTTDDGLDYFVVRNSWGETWGDAGYIKLARQSTTINGTCGILTWPSRPQLRDD